MKNKTIKVDYLSRVEGEGGLFVKIKDNELSEVKFKIFEPPRFYEAFLRDRKYYEAPDITARICGICPMAYMTSASQAMENAFGIKIDGQIRALRRLIYCGEWIESHALHVFLLHAPDFLGYPDGIQLAKDHPDIVNKALHLKKIGNEVMIVIGGREIHPVNFRVGGFYKAPAKKDLTKLLDDLKRAQDFCVDAVKWTAQLQYPDFEYDYEYVALRHPDEYAIIEGHVVSNKGLDIPVNEYDQHFIEEHVQHSTSLHAYIKGRGAYMTGPLARYNLNFEQLTPLCKSLAAEINMKPPVNNPFKSIAARMIETLYAVEESLRLIEQYEEPDKPYIEHTPRAATCSGASEAPRGICYHRYHVDDKGVILDAKIIPPTSQNQKMIESDLWHFVSKFINEPKDKLQMKCEQAIRNYDPCISCSCHFLNLEIERED